VEIEYSGVELLPLPLQALTQAVAKGLLDLILAEKVNFVNAPFLLKERKIDLVTSSTSETTGYSGLIKLTVQGKGSNCSAAGTVLPGKELRLVRLNNYCLETELEGVNLIIQNLDKPGVIGFIGSTLGKYQVNIANMHLSRTAKNDKAIAIVRLDEEAPSDALDALRSYPDLLSVQQVKVPN
jgi:D-3-phosphoglycerate dehydrogenase